jgi:hypothetical protein
MFLASLVFPNKRKVRPKFSPIWSLLKVNTSHSPISLFTRLSTSLFSFDKANLLNLGIALVKVS